MIILKIIKIGVSNYLMCALMVMVLKLVVMTLMIKK